MNAKRELAAVCAALALGAVAVLGAVSRTWVHISAARDAPLPPLAIDVSGRTLSPAIAGLGLVLLAGALAVLASSGRARQLLGGVLVGLSAALVAAAMADAGGVSDHQARSVLANHSTGVGLVGKYPVGVDAQLIWPWLCVAGGLLCLVASLAVAVRGGRWRTMAARYDAPGSSESDRHAGSASPDQRTAQDLALWNALDRGDDPTRR